MRICYMLGAILYGNADLNKTLSAPSWSLGTRGRGQTINNCIEWCNIIWNKNQCLEALTVRVSEWLWKQVQKLAKEI